MPDPRMGHRRSASNPRTKVPHPMSDDEDSEDAGALSGTVIAGRYKVIKRLGTGGMGQVFLVQHVHTDEHFALKALLETVIEDANALERFRREARTPARIDSDHVV